MAVGINHLRDGEKLHAAGFKIIVQVEADKAKETAPQVTNIYVPREVEEKEAVGAERGVIVEVGALAGKVPGESPEAWGIKVGNIVYFNRYQTHYFKRADGQRYLIIGDRDILAYIDPEETVDV